MRYKSVMATERGGPEVLQVVDNDLRLPQPGESRVKILASPVCLPDIQARYGHTPIAPKVPFVPGYAFVGIVDAVGQDVTSASVGDRVAGLTISGAYAENAPCARVHDLDVDLLLAEVQERQTARNGFLSVRGTDLNRAILHRHLPFYA